MYTSTAVLKLAEQGRLELSEDASRYLPELKNLRLKSDKSCLCRPLTVRQLLSMTGGFGYDTDSESLTRLRAREDTTNSMREVIQAIGEEGLDFAPGEHFQYSLCHDILGGIIEAVSGKALHVYMEEEIFRPLP